MGQVVLSKISTKSDFHSSYSKTSRFLYLEASTLDKRNHTQRYVLEKNGDGHKFNIWDDLWIPGIPFQKIPLITRTTITQNITKVTELCKNNRPL